MTFKLNPEVEKIISPIVLIFLEGEKREYERGTDVADATFEKRYIISSFRADNDRVEIKLVEPAVSPSSWIGEEQMSFF